MNSVDARFYELRRINQLSAHHPEWWSIGCSLICWSIIFSPIWGTKCALCHAHAPLYQQVGTWLLMVVAMMIPLMVFPVRTTAFNSLWRRRHWAIAMFLAGYLLTWVLVGVVCSRGMVAVSELWDHHSQLIACGAFLCAALWQTTSWKQHALVACHRTRPLAPAGLQADRDCFVYGAEHGFYCVLNCGFLMIAAMLSPWSTLMMLFLTGLLIYERYKAKFRDKWVPIWIIIFGIGQILL